MAQGRRELLIGCGKDRTKRMGITGDPEWSQLTTLDINPLVNPDVLWDLNMMPLPFDDNEFDELHAYEVLEHCGEQGNWKFFFDQFSEFWRILKHRGFFYATMPAPDSVFVWADPGHRRTFMKETLVYLDQDSYKFIVNGNTITDYRFCYKADFKTMQMAYLDGSFRFILQAIKEL